jgi:hypothetical protein
VADEQRHDQEGAPTGGSADIVNLNDARMLDVRKGPSLEIESREELGLVGEVLMDDLDRDALAEANMHGLPDLADAALTEEPLGAVLRPLHQVVVLRHRRLPPEGLVEDLTP